MKSVHSYHTIQTQVDPIPSESAASSVRSLQSSWSGWDYTDIGYEFTDNQQRNSFPKLVDYSVTDDTLNSEKNIPVNDVNASKNTHAIRHSGRSLSLDDLHLLNRRERIRGESLKSLNEGHKCLEKWQTSRTENFSSCSTVTLVPQENITFKMLQIPSRKHQFKNLTKRKDNEEDSQYCNPIRGCNEPCLQSDGSDIPCQTSDNDELSNAGSLNNASFEYISGSAYNKQVSHNDERSIGNISPISIRSTTREVTEGVDLVIQYVNGLRISDKRKVIRKVAESLMNNVDVTQSSNSSLSTRSALLFNIRDLISKNKRRSTLCFRSTCEETSYSANSASNSEKSDFCSSSPLASDLSKPCSKSISSSTEFYKSSEISKQTTSSMTIDNYDSGTSVSNNARSLTQNRRSRIFANSYSDSLKECLKKERDTQLLWIKSNIRHLKNLKKLCENQKILRSELSSFKKPTTDVTKPSSLFECNHSNHEKAIENSKRKEKIRIVDSSKLNDQNSDESCKTSQNIDRKTDEGKKKKAKNRKHGTLCDSDSNSLHSTRLCHISSASSENKENLSTNTPKKLSSYRSHRRSTNIVGKPAVEYSIFFHKKTMFPHNADFKIKEMSNMEIVKQKSEKRMDKEFRRRKSAIITYMGIKSSFPLQEYLLRNKPEYVNRAEYRRKCLAEVARLRQLREESRLELLNSLQNVTELNSYQYIENCLQKQCVLPKIFNEKIMKKETKEKYLQLPEVKHKEAERKKQLNYSRNQLMAKLFSKRLQKKVLKGQVDLSNRATLVGF